MNEVTEDMVGCLVWVWDSDSSLDEKKITILRAVIPDDDFYTVIDNEGISWECCQPIKPEEVKFYKEKTDE